MMFSIINTRTSTSCTCTQTGVYACDKTHTHTQTHARTHGTAFAQRTGSQREAAAAHADREVIIRLAAHTAAARLPGANGRCKQGREGVAHGARG